MNELVLEKINVSLENKSILHDINIDVKKGELISILGPSGCGKTTLLKVIAGLVDINNGKVIISGSDCNEIQTEKRGTVIVFQDLRLFPHMNVIENIEFGLRMKGVDRKIRREKALDILEKVELKGFEKRKVNHISGGQCQRVAIARAITAEPKILLLDEPFSSLDKSLRIKMRELVVKLHKELGMTTIMVTHDEEEAFMMSDRVVVMMNGEVKQYGTSKEIYEMPSCIEVANLLGEMNYIHGEVKCKKFKSKVGIFNVDMADGKYSLMVRPKDIVLNKSSSDYIVSDIRYLGGEYIIKVNGNGETFLIKDKSDCGISEEDKVGLEFKIDKGIFYELKI